MDKYEQIAEPIDSWSVRSRLHGRKLWNTLLNLIEKKCLITMWLEVRTSRKGEINDEGDKLDLLGTKSIYLFCQSIIK